MRTSRPAPAILLAFAAILSAGCHRSAVQTASLPTSWPEEEYCWWAPLRTTMSADSVAARYARAFASMGLSGAGWSHQADTAWAAGGPTLLSRGHGTARFAARVVAYRRGDTTLVRPFVGASRSDGADRGQLAIPFCGDAIRAAAALTTTPRGEERDDSLRVWRRRPLR